MPSGEPRLLLRAIQNLKIHGVDVIYVEKNLCVLNKASGVISQLKKSANSSSTEDHGLNPIVRLLNEHLPRPQNWSALHRLDRTTTGCLAFGTLGTTSFVRFSEQFATRQIGKEYLALVRTDQSQLVTKAIREGHHDEETKLRSSWLQDSTGRPRFTHSSVEGAKPAEATWRVIAHSAASPVALLKMRLLTGRKHQLRLHAAEDLHVPILGDQRYTPQTFPQLPLSLPEDRVYLHASTIGLKRFVTLPPTPQFPKRKAARTTIRLTAPLPHDFVHQCSRLGIQVPRASITGRAQWNWDAKGSGLDLGADSDASLADDGRRQPLLDGQTTDSSNIERQPGWRNSQMFEIPALGGTFFPRGN
ncbi:pseudouridine synthase [Clavulina sp. PMI_390]|nr:pseudouridine synthase [Clavulina sp. PMI_390]